MDCVVLDEGSQTAVALAAEAAADRESPGSVFPRASLWAGRLPAMIRRATVSLLLPNNTAACLE